MANPWFRMYSEFADDPKVQMMSEADQRRLLMIFCLRCKEPLETLLETEIAFHLRITPLELGVSKSIFIEKGFIDEKWCVLNWDRRQFVSDSSTERVRRFRQAQKQDETFQEADVTLQNRTESEQNQKKTTASQITFELPSWINQETWEVYLEVRSSKKAAKTPRAWNMVVKQLAEFRAKGHNPNSILETSIRSNWIDVYEPQQSGGKTNGKSTDRAYQTATKLINEIEDNYGSDTGELLPWSGTQ